MENKDLTQQTCHEGVTVQTVRHTEELEHEPGNNPGARPLDSMGKTDSEQGFKPLSTPAPDRTLLIEVLGA